MHEAEHLKYVQFFAGLSTHLRILKELRSVYNEQMAFDFNATSLFLCPDENKTSEILAFFLDPSGSHGQKNAFLRVFCETLLRWDHERCDALIGKEVKVNTEYRIDARRRIDILVSFGQGKFLVGFENKIGAEDQPKQLQDYSAYLKKQSTDNYCLFYLNPDGHDPSEDSISQDQRAKLEEDGKLRIISYKDHIIDLFEKFIMICKSDKVTAFLRDFQQYLYLRILFKGAYNMSDSMTIKDFITKNPENIELALQVATNISEVKEYLYKKVVDELDKWSSYDAANRPKIDSRHLSEARGKYGCLIQLKHEGWDLLMEFGMEELRRLAIVIGGRKEGPVDRELLKGIMEALEYPKLSTNHTNIHRYPPDYQESWDTNASPWLDMARRSDDPNYSKFTKKIIDWHDEAFTAIKAKLGEKNGPPSPVES